jgi:hypothetical protein
MSAHHVAVRAAALLTLLVAGCNPSGEGLTVANKKECIPEVARRLVACNDAADCEKGVTRFAGYCYNSAEGDQLDICRGGQYFFEQALAALKQNDPTLFGQLAGRREEIMILTGETYCRYNTN